MKPVQFKYLAAHDLDQALILKSEYGDEARFLAGGQSLLPLMNFRLSQPAVLIDINPLSFLDYVRPHAAGGLHIGALTRHRTVERHPLIARDQPLLHEAMPNIAHPQIRNRGTLAGNLAHADPASELPAVMLALNARMHLQSKGRERWVDASDFFIGALATALQPDEMLVQVELTPSKPRTGSSFMEVSRRQGDFPLIGVAALIALDNAGLCADARLVFCNVADRPINAAQAAKSLIGGAVGESEINEAAILVQHEIEPGGNIHASSGFQRHLAGVLTKRSIKVALNRASARATSTI
jgi:carbon-monoxide dehydrogenase medium subunit